MDWSHVKIRCSSLGVLFVEPKDKKDKDAGELSKAAKTHLIKTYIKERWNREREITSKYMNKGNLVEQDAVTLLSRVDKHIYVTNKVRKENEYISGMADIVDAAIDLVIDTKASWDAETFLVKVIEAVDKMYAYQLQGYMWLWGLSKAKLSYCLVNTPEILIKSELRRLLFNMDVATDENPEYKKAAEEMVRNMTFDNIPIQERVISYYVHRDEEIIKQIPGKVIKSREFLIDLEKKHLSAYSPSQSIKIKFE